VNVEILKPWLGFTVTGRPDDLGGGWLALAEVTAGESAEDLAVEAFGIGRVFRGRQPVLEQF
jgi:hypothetical protein